MQIILNFKKKHFLILGLIIAVPFLFIAITNIFAATPGGQFHSMSELISGKIKIGNDASPEEAGMLRYFEGNFQGYNGTEWNNLSNSNIAEHPTIRLFVVEGNNVLCPPNSDILIKKWAPTTCTSSLGSAVCSCTTTASGWQINPTTCEYNKANWYEYTGYGCGGSTLTCYSNQWSAAICIGGN